MTQRLIKISGVVIITLTAAIYLALNTNDFQQKKINLELKTEEIEALENSTIDEKEFFMLRTDLDLSVNENKLNFRPFGNEMFVSIFNGYKLNNISNSEVEYYINPVKVFPNPLNNGENLTVVIENKSDTYITINLFSLNSKLIYHSKKNVIIGLNTIDLVFPYLDKGIYYLKIGSNPPIKIAISNYKSNSNV